MSNDAWTTFFSSDMVEALAMLARLRIEAQQVGDAPLALDLSQVVAALDTELGAAARRTAAVADDAIRQKIRETAKRPDTAHPIHLLDAIRSAPIAQGVVAVGLLEELNKVENSETGGIYWRTQEEGSVAVGNIMTGRPLFGRFVSDSTGYSDVPRAEYGGAGNAPGAEFFFGDLSGDPPGFGTIQHEIQPRHFLRDGADAAFAEYQREITDLSRRYAARVDAMSVVAAA